MTHTIDDLRDHLFATLTALRDKENPMPIDRAKAVADVAQTVINSAKVEVDMINAAGTKHVLPTGFLGRSLEHQGHARATSLPEPVRAGAGLPPCGPTASLR